MCLLKWCFQVHSLGTGLDGNQMWCLGAQDIWAHATCITGKFVMKTGKGSGSGSGRHNSEVKIS